MKIHFFYQVSDNLVEISLDEYNHLEKRVSAMPCDGLADFLMAADEHLQMVINVKGNLEHWYRNMEGEWKKTADIAKDCEGRPSLIQYARESVVMRKNRNMDNAYRFYNSYNPDDSGFLTVAIAHNGRISDYTRYEEKYWIGGEGTIFPQKLASGHKVPLLHQGRDGYDQLFVCCQNQLWHFYKDLIEGKSELVSKSGHYSVSRDVYWLPGGGRNENAILAEGVTSEPSIVETKDNFHIIYNANGKLEYRKRLNNITWAPPEIISEVKSEARFKLLLLDNHDLVIIPLELNHINCWIKRSGNASWESYTPIESELSESRDNQPRF